MRKRLEKLESGLRGRRQSGRETALENGTDYSEERGTVPIGKLSQEIHEWDNGLFTSAKLEGSLTGIDFFIVKEYV